MGKEERNGLVHHSARWVFIDVNSPRVEYFISLIPTESLLVMRRVCVLGNQQLGMQPGYIIDAMTMPASEVAFPAATASFFDRKMGRRPSKVPEHLSRVLYIPRHDVNTLHFPIYEARAKYCNAVHDTLMGSTLFTTKLGFMEIPRGDDMKDQVEYLATKKEPAESISQIHLQRREPGTRGPGRDMYD
jgi:hypothetical protein